MARRNRTLPRLDRTEEITERISKLLSSPLQNIGQALKSEFDFIEHSVRIDAANEDILKIFVSQISAILEILPDTFGERFWFDAQMIYAIASTWNGNSQRLSATIIPKPHHEWAHASTFVPSGIGNRERKSINVIFFPGRDTLSDIDLLNYPWVCHELAHNLFYYDDSLFVDSFNRRLNSFLGSLRLRAIADHGSARSKSHALISHIEEFWAPTLTHKNWAHEMAMDIVALWTCGPSFLAAFQDEIEDETKNPYLVDKVHPPYAVRAIALLKAGKALGWQEHTQKIRGILEHWRKSKSAKQVDNSYLALSEPLLTEGVVACAQATCHSLSLPKCTPTEIERIKGLLVHDEIPDFGVDLIIAAWLVREQEDEETFSRWETAKIRSRLDSLMQ